MARAAVTAAESVRAPLRGQPAGTIEEAELVSAWLERPGIRLVECQGEWAWPLHATIAAGDLPRYAWGDDTTAIPRMGS